MIKYKNTKFSEQNFYINDICKMLDVTKYQIKGYLKDNDVLNFKFKTGNVERTLYTWSAIDTLKKEFKITHNLKRKVIVISNAKGGTGKTSFASNIAFEACSRGIKTLCIDLDSQSHFTYNLGLKPKIDTKNFNDCLTPYGSVKKDGMKDIIQELNPLLHLIPATINLNDVELALKARMRNSEYALREALDQVKDDYELIVIDTSPYVGQILINALCIADTVVIPSLSDFNSHMGITYFKKVLKRIFIDESDAPEILIVPNRYNKNKNICKEAVDEMKKRYPKEVYPQPIRESTDIENALKDQKSLKQYKKSSRAFDDFNDLATFLFISKDGGLNGVQ